MTTQVIGKSKAEMRVAAKRQAANDAFKAIGEDDDDYEEDSEDERMFGTKKVKSIAATQPASGAAASDADAGAGSGANAGSAVSGADEDAAASGADADAAASNALAEVGQTTSDATATSDARARGFEAAGAAVEPKVAVSAPASVPKAAEAVPETVPGASAPGAAAFTPTSVSTGAAGEL